MPPKKQQKVFVLATETALQGISGIYATEDAALAACEGQAGDVMVEERDVSVKNEASKPKAFVTPPVVSKPPLTGPTSTANTKAKATKRSEEPEEEDDADDANDAPPAKKADAKKQIPEGKPNALAGLKLIFTGTFEIDRATCKATAEKYGAKVISKLEDTDYVVLGVKAGDKKLQEIEDKGLDTIEEADFYKMLKTGVPAEKRKQVDARAGAEPAKKKQKK